MILLNIRLQQKKYILQSGAVDVNGMPVVIDVLPLLDCADDVVRASVDDDTTATEPTSTNTSTNTTTGQPANASSTSGASSPNSLNGSTSQRLTAQVAVVQTSEDMEPHYITVTSKLTQNAHDLRCLLTKAYAFSITSQYCEQPLTMRNTVSLTFVCHTLRRFVFT